VPEEERRLLPKGHWWLDRLFPGSDETTQEDELHTGLEAEVAQ